MKQGSTLETSIVDVGPVQEFRTKTDSESRSLSGVGRDRGNQLVLVSKEFILRIPKMLTYKRKVKSIRILHKEVEKNV